MERKEKLEKLLSSVGFPATIKGLSPVGGGCIADALRADLADGSQAFVKILSAKETEVFAAEGAGLTELARGGSLRVPQVYGWGRLDHREAALVMEYIPQGRKSSLDFAAFGAQVASLHKSTQDHYGWERDNFIGSNPQLNPASSSWVSFFRDHRLGYQMKLGLRSGTITGRFATDLGRLLDRLDRALPEPPEGPSLLHGDLWGGNYLVDQQGSAVLIDPAVYYGHREADLAMTQMFGGFERDFYRGYQEAWPLEPGSDKRMRLYNLYHYLNHLNIFGSGYLSSCRQIVREFL